MKPHDRQLLECRNAYAYPRAYLESLYGGSTLPTGVQLPKPATPERVALTSQDAWEERHRSLLRSNDSQDAALGLASIVFWGFYGGSEGGVFAGRALTRAYWARDGRSPEKGAPDRSLAHAALQEAARRVDSGDLSGALLAIKGIAEFGQLSFASKVLAALAPERAAVYDKVIADTLKAGGSVASEYFVSPNQGGITGPKADTYARWCELCRHRAAEMNQYGISVSGWDSDGTGKRAWRPVDVERAFFGSRQVALLFGATR
ncbi:hypothetical protein [Hydrogenophaga sp.]|uniref:8-oxoguanine DNA glycosylase OGG fold protein n=1 Tax=Hydrogenophaga sp. TaxID=1904254 RepID=UPI00391DA879